MRVARADLDKLLRPASPAGVSVSSLLTAKREEVESLGLELQAERGKRELAKLHEQDAEADRQRTEARRAEALANKCALAEFGLQRERDAERREREHREAEAERRQAEFERKWAQWATEQLATNRKFAWLTFEQRESVLRMVEQAVAARGPQDEPITLSLLSDGIARMVAPWAAERELQVKREELIGSTVRRLPYGVTDAENARAAMAARTALSQIPLSAGNLEIRAAADAAVEPITKAIEQRNAAERAESQRRYRKDRLVSVGVNRISGYLLQLRLDEEIDEDALWDFVWRRELENAVRQELYTELTGAEEESEADAERVAEEIVDSELD